MSQQAANADQARKWAVWQEAERRAARMWADPSVSHQAKRAACGEASAAEQQWSDAVDRMVEARAA